MRVGRCGVVLEGAVAGFALGKVAWVSRAASGRSWAVAGILGLSMMMQSAPVAAAEPRWPDEIYNYVVVDQDLRMVLQEFGDHLGLSVMTSDGVSGRVRGKIPPLPPREFLDRLTAMYGLTWYYDGNVLSVVPIKETVSKLLPLGRVPFESLRGSLDSLQISDPRFPMRYSAGSNLLLVAGPPRYVELVEQAIGAITGPKPADVIVIRGSHQP